MSIENHYFPTKLRIDLKKRRKKNYKNSSTEASVPSLRKLWRISLIILRITSFLRPIDEPNDRTWSDHPSNWPSNPSNFSSVFQNIALVPMMSRRYLVASLNSSQTIYCQGKFQSRPVLYSRTFLTGCNIARNVVAQVISTNPVLDTILRHSIAIRRSWAQKHNLSSSHSTIKRNCVCSTVYILLQRHQF